MLRAYLYVAATSPGGPFHKAAFPFPDSQYAMGSGRLWMSMRAAAWICVAFQSLLQEFDKTDANRCASSYVALRT
eukprot:2993227-Pleurochrysis_carterae.AAC.3